MEELHLQESQEDDDDEGFVSHGKPGHKSLFEINLDTNLLNTTKCIIFADGIQAINFSKSYLPFLSPQPVGKVENKTKNKDSDIEVWGLHYKQPEPSLFFQMNEDTLLCTCSPTMYSEDYYSFSKEVLKSFSNLLNVVIITVSSITNYKSEDYSNELDKSFLMRTLSTSSFNSPKITKLEQPNMLEGVTAGLLTVCELSGMSAIACVAFTPSLNLDREIVHGFTSFFRSVDATAKIKMVASPQSKTSSDKTGNLYT